MTLEYGTGPEETPAMDLTAGSAQVQGKRPGPVGGGSIHSG